MRQRGGRYGKILLVQMPLFKLGTLKEYLVSAVWELSGG